MAGRRFQGDHGCCRDRADGSCALAMVGRLSGERVRDLAEDIWTASTGRVMPARPSPDPRSSRPGASAEAAYRRRRQQEREAWRPGCATAGALGPLEQAGYLVLHDITLPGWPAGLDHLVVGSTGIWALGSWQRGRLVLPRNRSSRWPACGATAGPLRELHWQAAAIADALATGDSIYPDRLMSVSMTCPQRAAFATADSPPSLRSRSSSARSSAERLGVSDRADTVLVCMSRLPGVPGSLADLLGSGIT
jgi:hypothetical protein